MSKITNDGLTQKTERMIGRENLTQTCEETTWRRMKRTRSPAELDQRRAVDQWRRRQRHLVTSAMNYCRHTAQTPREHDAAQTPADNTHTNTTPRQHWQQKHISVLPWHYGTHSVHTSLYTTIHRVHTYLCVVHTVNIFSFFYGKHH